MFGNLRTSYNPYFFNSVSGSLWSRTLQGRSLGPENFLTISLILNCSPQADFTLEVAESLSSRERLGCSSRDFKGSESIVELLRGVRFRADGIIASGTAFF